MERQPAHTPMIAGMGILLVSIGIGEILLGIAAFAIASTPPTEIIGALFAGFGVLTIGLGAVINELRRLRQLVTVIGSS